MGYWLAEEHQGKGLMTMACSVVLDYAFGELGQNHVEICAVPERLGFTHESTTRQSQWLRDRHVDEAVYGMLASDWEAARFE